MALGPAGPRESRRLGGRPQGGALCFAARGRGPWRRPDRVLPCQVGRVSIFHVNVPPNVDTENTSLSVGMSATMAQAAGLMPAATLHRKAMSVARAYVPLSGSQMYVLPTRITANAQDLATSAARTPASGDQVRAHLHSMQFTITVHLFIKT